MLLASDGEYDPIHNFLEYLTSSKACKRTSVARGVTA